MRRQALLLCVSLCAAAPLAADELVLKDGRRIALAKPYSVRGSQVIVTRQDGTLLSVPLEEVDVAKSDAARGRGPAATPTPSLLKPLTPAEAARQKTSRKAAVVLDDRSVAHGYSSGGDAAGDERKSEDAGRVEVSGVSPARTKDGYTVTGTLMNQGRIDVSAVALTIEAIGDENKTLSSTFAAVAKDSLSPGEKTTFTATLSTDREARSFRYVPRWQVNVPIKAEAAPGTSPSATPGPSESPAPSPAPAAAAPPAAPTALPRPDIAPRAPNAPVGAPSQPGGTYLPKPSGDQPKPPGGG